MIILITGDWHIRNTRPRNRLDEDYPGAIFEKIEWILNRKFDVVLQAGDLFDTWKITRIPHYIVNITANILLKYVWDKNARFFTIRGQHDLRFRGNIEDTPLAILETTDIAWISKEEDLGNNITLYGCGFGEEIPKIKNKSNFNILLIHKMITEDGPLWPGQTDYVTGRELLKKHSFDLVVSGDNHKSFFSTYKDKVLINCGSLMRNNTDQFDHEPVIYLFDTETRKYEKIKIPVKPSEQVLKLDTKNSSANETVSLVKGIEEKGGDVELNFFKSAKEEKELMELDEDVWNMFREAYEECKDEL